MKNISRKKKNGEREGTRKEERKQRSGWHMSRAKLKQSNTKGKQSWTEQNLERERERDSIPLASSSASARTFIPKSDLVSPTVSLSSLFLQKIPSPSFLPSFVLLFLCSHRERKGEISMQYCSYHSISSYSSGDSFDWLILVCFVCFSLNLLPLNSNPNQTQNQAFSFFVSFEYFLLGQRMNK